VSAILKILFGNTTFVKVMNNTQDTKKPESEKPEGEEEQDTNTLTDPVTENKRGLEEEPPAISQLLAENTQLKEDYIRAQAEVQNTRRRAEEEMAKTRKFAIESFAQSLLPILDSFEAGLNVQEANIEQIQEGAKATLQQLQQMLSKQKIVEIAPLPGEKFDPNKHQAISTVPAPEDTDFASGTIASVLQKGYSMSERILRPALVSVVQ
jgi:molecular chaperone GrpE